MKYLLSNTGNIYHNRQIYSSSFLLEGPSSPIVVNELSRRVDDVQDQEQQADEPQVPAPREELEPARTFRQGFRHCLRAKPRLTPFDPEIENGGDREG
jgi:hypothetical protein